MSNEPDYKKNYELLDEALENAIQILQKARARTKLNIQLFSGGLTADDEGDSAASYEKAAREYAGHAK